MGHTYVKTDFVRENYYYEVKICFGFRFLGVSLIKLIVPESYNRVTLTMHDDVWSTFLFYVLLTVSFFKVHVESTLKRLRRKKPFIKQVHFCFCKRFLIKQNILNRDVMHFELMFYLLV